MFAARRSTEAGRPSAAAGSTSGRGPAARALTGAALHAVLALLLLLAADAVAVHECFDTAFGLPDDGITMTERGCEVTIETAELGDVRTPLPTFDQGLGTAAVLVGITGAVWPLLALRSLTRSA